MKKICVVITARPSYSRVRTVLMELNNNPKIDLQIILCCSAIIEKYGDVSEQVKNDNLNIFEKLYTLSQGEEIISVPKTTGITIIELSNSFSKLKPDAVVTIADRYETLATSIAASYQNIPLIHLQGGEITGNIDEKVRHANTKLSDLHLVSNESAKEVLLRMGEIEKSIFVTGCPSIDLAKKVTQETIDSFKPFEKYGGVGRKIDINKKFIVVLQHPHTPEYRIAGKQIIETLNALLEINLPVIWFWPNVDIGTDSISKQLRSFRENNPDNNFHFFKNFESEDFLKLLIKSSCIVGNSSVAIRECAFLGVPAVDIGDRQKNRIKGSNVISVRNSKKEIIKAIREQLIVNKYPSENIYGNGDSSKIISKIISSFEFNLNKQFVRNSIN